MELPERSSEGQEPSNEFESLPRPLREAEQESSVAFVPLLNRERLCADLSMIDGCLQTYEFHEYDVSRVRKDARALKAPGNRAEALTLSLDSIDQRMLALFGVSLEIDMLEDEFPFYKDMANKCRLKPLVDNGESRGMRYELLDDDVRAAIQSIDSSLDKCDAKQVNRYRLAFNLFRVYRETFGMWRGPNGESYPRPWNQPTVLHELVPPLSETTESDITPIPEINEND